MRSSDDVIAIVGLTAVVAAALFALSTVLAPVLASFPPEATGCPLVLVGFYMIGGIETIEWRNPAVAIPAFITIVVIPATSNVAYGVFAGLATSLAVWIPSKLLACCGIVDEDTKKENETRAAEEGGDSTEGEGGGENEGGGGGGGDGDSGAAYQNQGGEGDKTGAGPDEIHMATWTAV